MRCHTIKLALALDPGLLPAYINLGNALGELGKLDEAAVQYQRALTLNPGYAEAYRKLGTVLKLQGNFDAALLRLRQALAIEPHRFDAYGILGAIFESLGKSDEAILVYRRGLALNPTDAETHNNFGNLLGNCGKVDEAIIHYLSALALRPDYAEAHSNLGNALSNKGRIEEAALAYRRALALRPEFAEAHSNLGMAYLTLGNLHDAETELQQALIINPGFVPAYSNLGMMQHARGRLDDAIQCFERALALNPAFVAARANLGASLRAGGRLAEAVAQCQQALALAPDDAKTLTNLGGIFKDQGRVDAAATQYRRALAMQPDFAIAYSNLLFSLIYDETLSVTELFAAHQEWDKRYGLLLRQRRAYRNDRAQGRRLKIGYVSGDFRQHSVAYFLEPLLRSHDPAAVEVFCYAEVAQPDAVTQRFKRLAHHWRTTVGLADDAMADQIRADGIDILVDLAGHTAGNRLAVFARKPAPVQVTWLGYPHSTGLSAIDYRLVDVVTDPMSEVTPNSEKLVRLERPFLCYAAPTDAPSPAPPPSRARGAMTFGSFNNPTKYSAGTLEAWAQILRRLPDARLLLKGHPLADAATRRIYADRLRELGVSPQRVTLAGIHSRPKHAPCALWRDRHCAGSVPL